MKLAEVLAGPDKWTQQASARDKLGESVEVLDPTACRYCLYGAACALALRLQKPSYRLISLVADVIVEKHPQYDGYSKYNVIVSFNDAPNRKFEEVQAVVAEVDRKRGKHEAG